MVLCPPKDVSDFSWVSASSLLSILFVMPEPDQESSDTATPKQMMKRIECCGAAWDTSYLLGCPKCGRLFKEHESSATEHIESVPSEILSLKERVKELERHIKRLKQEHYWLCERI